MKCLLHKEVLVH